MADENLFFASIGELGAKLQSREVSAVELARAFGRRLAQLGPLYNALALPLPEEAVRSARAVDADLKRERLRGPLQGIPYAVKDLLALAGRPTSWGAAPYTSHNYNAAIVEKLDRVGAPLAGKLTMAQVAGAGVYRMAGDPLTGPALNPWDRTRWAGGSSCGSAAAVAAGLVPFAIGSESSGSILTPAAYCGVTALRPTYGLVSRYGAMALSWTLDKLGPFCRSAEDCGLVLQAISGGDRRDPGSAGKSFYYTPQYARKLPDLRVGFAPVDFEEWAEPEARPAFRKAVEVIRQSGVKMSETKLPDFPYGAVIGTILSAEASAAFEPLIESGAVDKLGDPRQIAGLRAGLEIPARQYLKAMRIRRVIHAAFRKLFADVDVLLAPARPGTASAVEESVNRRASDRITPALAGMNAIEPAGNLAGLPSLVLPCGFAGNLPVAIQLVGRPFSENTLLALGREFQSRTDWHRRQPPEA
ncbi:MAG TPA: amidase [Bryobacteraceae bacterium]|nr:amidase [Bryobacteraceae bacterium]